MERFVLAYDADCGPCTQFKRLVGFLDVRRQIDSIPLIQADSEGLLASVPVSLRHRSFHLVAPDGNVLSGATAIPTLVGLLPGGRFASRVMTSAPGGIRTVGFVYAVLSRLHDAGSCSYKPGSGPPSLRKAGDVAVLPKSLPALRLALS